MGKTDYPRYLHLSDGTIIRGAGFGGRDPVFGEVVFTTGMTGYPETLTDPSFAGQILIFTYPLIGNYGVPDPVRAGVHLMKNFESEKIHVRGVACGQASDSFSRWLAQAGVPGIMDIDTRALTQKIREHGVMGGYISSRATAPQWKNYPADHPVSRVSVRKPFSYVPEKSNNKHVALIDCGVKHGIIRALLAHGYMVTRIPWDADPLDVPGIDGVVCSNGPGDPKACGPTIANIRNVLAAGLPFLGVCLGHQLLALAIGADTYKLKYGHRGLNQPCQDLMSKKAYVTSQNHGYAVNRKTIPRGYKEWFVNLNDNTNEGIRHTAKNIQSVQFHPEGSPGPFDTDWIFDFLL